MSEPKMLTYKDAADLLGLQLGTLYAMVSRRQVPHVRLGRRLVRFDAVSLDEWVRARRVDVMEVEERHPA